VRISEYIKQVIKEINKEESPQSYQCGGASKVKKSIVESNSMSNGNANVADVYLFYTEWCPHCKSAKPIWENLKQQVGSYVNETKVNFIKVDCEADTATKEKFNIHQYPTVLMVRGNQVATYGAKPRLDALSEFINKNIQ